jgi:apolipoprotein N-acyltransferase
MVAATLAYGYFRLSETPPAASDGRVLRVALIQGCFPTRFDSSHDDARRNFDDYLDASEKVCKAHPNLDLVIWPESMFTSTEPDVVINGRIEPPPGVEDTGRFEEIVRSYLAAFKDKSLYASKRINRVGGKWKLPNKTQLLVGCETQELGPHAPRRYNSALLIDDNGQVAGRYYKMHRVMFGEYVPGGTWFPWVYTLTPMSEGLTAGSEPSQLEVAGMRLAPSICFESTVPHLVRRQLHALEQKDSSPDVLVNVTNDGWFWGSNALDLHLTCGIFRAIEQRMPMLIAANTGFSAVIDGNGMVRQRGPRFEEATLVADVTADGRQSIYQWLGDLPAWGCALFVCLSAVVGCWDRFRRE